MKKAILGLCILFANLATAAQSGSPGHIVQILSSPKVAVCLQKLYALSDRYDLRTSDSDISVTTPTADLINTEIVYMLIAGGDMGAGQATLVIQEKLFPQFGFANTKIPLVTGCNLSTSELH